MRLIDVAFNNIRRRKGRMVLVVLGLTLGVATVIALVSMIGTMQADVAQKLDEYGANILIVPKANDLSLSYGGVTVASAAYDVGALSEQDLGLIETIKNARNISVIAPKLLGALPIDGNTTLVAGVRFEDELRLKQWWDLQGNQSSGHGDSSTAPGPAGLSLAEVLRVEPESDRQGGDPSGPGVALAGARLAEVLHLKPGSTLDIGDRTFRVAGVLAENGSQDDGILFIDLAEAQQIMDKPGGVSLVEVAALCTECPVEDMVAQISGVLPQARVTALRQAVTLRMETVGQLSRFALAVAVVVLLIGALVVLTTMFGAVTERRQEIGLFRALGFRQQHIIQIILSEAALMGLLGGLLGWLLGTSAAALLTPHLAGITAVVSWDPVLALGAICGALMVGLTASLYPAISAARLDPTIALRSL